MFVAMNKNKKRVHINDAAEYETYYCPICAEELIQKRGDINIHHFAHKNSSHCNSIDGWHYDMTEWHYDWQSQFPVENQEVVFEKDNKKHRADVFIKNTIIEFQHSNISEKEFNDRNEFYNNLGYKVIWIFDGRSKKIDLIEPKKPIDGELWSWKNAPSALNFYNYKNPKIDVYIQIGCNTWHKNKEYKKIVYKEDLEKIANGSIIMINWISQSGLKMFLSNKCVNDIEFLCHYIPMVFKEKPKEPKKYNKSEICDYHNMYGSHDYYGYCPVVNNHFFNFKNCLGCKYDNCGCTYRFKDYLKENISKITNINRNKEGNITSITSIIDGNKKTTYFSPTTSANTIKNILSLKPTIKALRLRNINDWSGVQLNIKNIEYYKKTNKCFGKYSKPESVRFSQKEYEIYKHNQPIWVVTWFVE